MTPFQSVSQQFYGSGGSAGGAAGTAEQVIYDIAEDSPETIRIDLPGHVATGGLVQLIHNGLALTLNRDFVVLMEEQGSALELRLPRDQMVPGDTLVATAQLL